MRGIFFIAGLLSLTACGIDSRGLITQSHNAEIGPDTVRVELKGMREFRVVRSGDVGAFGGSRDGELQDMTLSLSAENEFSSAMGSGNETGVINTTRPDTDHEVYTTIATGHFLRWGSMATYTDETIWVNMPRDGILTLRMRGRDLDCSGERICGRKDDGFFEMRFRLPQVPADLSDGCPRSQRFDWAVNGGIYRFVLATEVTNRASHRPVLRPTGGVICITNPVTEG
jgi:hypothetical protein